MNRSEYQEMQKWVDRYHQAGYRVIPIFHPDAGCKCSSSGCNDQCLGKVPRDKDWKDRFYDSEDFKRNGNIGLEMGLQPNGSWLLGIDIDGETPRQLKELPKTLTADTGRGTHMIYEVDVDAPFGNWTDLMGTRDKDRGYKYGYKGAVDTRYSRGALVAPPSKHKSGHTYTWREWRKPTKFPPEWQAYIIRQHRYRRPNVKTYRRWSDHPNHFLINPQ